MRVGRARRGVGGEGVAAVAGVGVEVGEERGDVLEAGVHALAVEGDHGVGGVAEDDACGAVVVGRALDGYERQVGVFAVLLA